MGTLGAIDREPAVYAHHVRALRACQNRKDDDAIGAHLTRGGFRDQSPKETKARKTPVHGRIVDFFTASPLTGRDRQLDSLRVPHVDFKPITPTIAPTGKDGRRRASKPTGMTAAQHVDYVTDGARIGIAAHIDYIGRVTGIAGPLGELAMDALDELAERDEKNALGRYTNIPGGWARARSLFEAGECAVPAPKTYELLASTADWETFAYLHIEQAQLLLVPSIEPSRADLDIVGHGMREARCDALVVKASSEGRRTLYCALGTWRRDDNHWRHARRLWLSPKNEPWLVPDPAEAEPIEAFYQLTSGPIRVAPQPFVGADIAAGLDRADAHLAAMWQAL